MSRHAFILQFLVVILAIGSPAAGTAAKPVGTFMPDGDVADAPPGFEEMCARDAVLCDVGTSPRLVARVADANPESAALEKRLVKSIDVTVNRAVIQISDIDNNGVDELWQRPAGRNPAGDCEDLAIEKRIRLIEAGFPSDRLFLAVAYRRIFGLHTVLVARLDDGDYVLDSLTSRVLPWSRVDYVWLRQQTIGNPRVWRRVGTPEPRNLIVQKKGRGVEVATS